MDLELARARAKAKLKLRQQQKDSPAEEVTEEPGISKLETIARMGGQGLSAGFQDEASAAIQPAVNKFLDFFTGNNVAESDKSTYDERVAEFRGDNEEARKANPKTAFAAELAGAGVGALAGGGLLGKVAQGAGKVAQGANALQKAGALKQAATAGALGGAGYSESNDLGGVAKDAALGGALGLVAGGAAKGAGKTLKTVAEYTGKGFKKGFDKVSEKLLSASEGMANLADNLATQNIELKSSTINRIGLDKAKKIGRALIDDGVATRPATAKAYLNTVEGLKKKAGKQLEMLYKQADSKGEKLMNPKEIRSQVQGFLQSFDFADPRQIQAADKEIMNMLAYKADDVGMSHMDVWDFIKKIDKKTNIYERASDPIEASKADTLNDVSKFLRQKLSEGIEALPNSGDIAKEIKGISEVYKTYSYAHKGLKQKVQDAYGRRLAMTVNKAGIVDKLTSGTPIRGALTGAADQASKSFASIGNIIKQSPQSMGKYSTVLEQAARRGGNSVAVTHHTLMQKDPEYREQYKKVQQDEDK